MMRKLVVVAMVVMTLMLTACTTSTVKPTGRRDRICRRLRGPGPGRECSAARDGAALLRVDRSCIDDDQVGGQVPVLGHSCVIQGQGPTGDPEVQYRPKGVVVRAGQSVTATFPDYCK